MDEERGEGQRKSVEGDDAGPILQRFHSYVSEIKQRQLKEEAKENVLKTLYIVY